jgi:hypothetical protein
MNTDHNPIARLITLIQQKWTRDASPFTEYPLVRWLIRPDQARLYEGFLRLESTEHGAIPEVLITMLTPFKSKETYADALVCDWHQAFEDDIKTKDKLAKSGKPDRYDPSDQYDSKRFLPVEESSRNSLSITEHSEHTSSINGTRNLIQMLGHFKETMIGDEMGLVVALLPHTVDDFGAMNLWLNNLLKESLDNNIRFMIFDHIGQNYFNYAIKSNPDKIKTLECELDLDGAISKIAKMGNRNSPEVKLRECILEMGKGVKNKSKEYVHNWGQKGLDVTQKSGSKALFATAHIVYAGMLFNFRLYEKIDELLTRGYPVAEKGLVTEEAACRPLVVQYNGFKAACYQLQGRHRDALVAYEQQASKAIEFGLPGLALTPYQLAYNLSKKHQPERYEALIKSAYDLGKSLEKEEQENSSFPAIALDYMEWLELKRRPAEMLATELEMIQLLGPTWKQIAKGIANKASTATENHQSLIPG